jgi:pre-60S factor REI1
MASKFGFFVPYIEHVEDLPELMDYIGQKVSVGNVCLWCNKGFHSLEGVQKHMVDKGHCKICLEGNEDEFQDFYSISLVEDDEEDWETDEEEEVDEEMEDVDVDEGVRNRQGKLADAARLSRKHCKTVQELTVSSREGTKVCFCM